MKTILFILTLSILTENYVLARFLGICPFLGVSKKLHTAVGMSLAVIFVMVLSTLVTYPIYAWVLCPLGLSYLQTIVFILVIAALVQFVEIVLKKYIPSLYTSLGIYLPLITTNCAVLGVTLLHFTKGYNYGEAIVNAFGSGVGFLLAMVLFAGVRERISGNNIPKFLQGLPITLIAASLVSLSFTGFAGIAQNAFNVTITPVEYENAQSGSALVQIAVPIAILAVIALLVGLGLSVASAVMAVKRDEKTELVREALPGANCGACGYTGCDGYAEAVATGKTDKTTLCVPGGDDTAKKLAEIMGVKAEKSLKKVARVHCIGTPENTKKAFDYKGTDSCLAATQLFGGDGECKYACIGFGDCQRACPYDAIHVCNGVAVVNPDACKGCSICVKTCPKGIISLEPMTKAKAVLCSNRDKGAVTRKVCEVGCIGCGLCVKACEYGAIKLENNLAVIDSELCTNCGKCVEKCPRKIIH